MHIYILFLFVLICMYINWKEFNDLSGYFQKKRENKNVKRMSGDYLILLQTLCYMEIWYYENYENDYWM